MNDAARELFAKSWKVPDGPARVAVLQEAERLAESDEVALFDIRMALCSAASFGGQPHVCLLALTQCLQRYDQDMERFGKHEHDLLWRYKWVLSRLPCFPQISLRQIEDALADFRSRIAKAGLSARTHLYFRWKTSLVLGDIDAARAGMTDYARLKRDSLSDCLACEVDSDIEFSAWIENWEECLEKSAGIIAGKLRCKEVPHRTFPVVAKVYARLGDEEKTRHYIKESTALTAGNPNFIEATSHLMEAAALIGDYATGVRLFETRLHWTTENYDIHKRFLFDVACSFLLSRAIRQNGDFSLRLSDALIENLGLPGNQAGAIVQWLDGKSLPAAAAFDQRNGNAYWGDCRRRMLELA